MTDWNPWAYAAAHYPHITICTTTRLPHPRKGATNFTDTIWLCDSLNQAGRRYTLTHELMHLDRGPVPPAMKDQEERIVDALAARISIPFDQLLEVVTRTEDLDAAAAALWTSPHGLKVRLANLPAADRERLVEVRRGQLAS